MKKGFTTGSCAAAAAKAATYMLLTGKRKENIEIIVPAGESFKAHIEDITIGETSASCAVIKDGGDDPDVTTGAYVYAKVSLKENTKDILIDGGEGIGRVTKKGLDQPPGNAAINSVPRQMIIKEIKEVCALSDYKEGLEVIISVPNGEEIAQKTFNPRFGIEGGISILGTTGIVEPMSTQALLDTIRLELNLKREEGEKIVAVSPGNYGLEFMKSTYGYDLERSVKCSNFIGDTIDMAADMGFEAMLLTGDIGKLIKLSGGMMNTHSMYGDCRMELIAASAVRCNVPNDVVNKILNEVATEAAIEILIDAGCEKEVLKDIMERIDSAISKKSAGRIKVSVIMYSRRLGFLGSTGGAQELLDRL